MLVMGFTQSMASGRLAVSFLVALVLTACGAAAVGNATLSWSPPMQNTDGSPLTMLAGYNIHYGTSPKALNLIIRLNNPTVTSYVVRNLGPGTYYFAVTAYSASGEESGLSPLISKTIP
jgi:hypothetical protein